MTFLWSIYSNSRSCTVWLCIKYFIIFTVSALTSAKVRENTNGGPINHCIAAKK